MREPPLARLRRARGDVEEAGYGTVEALSRPTLTTTGLAHYVAGQLRQSGFSRANALTGRPPGANQVTVVEYASGHRADAARVARALGVGQPEPMEATVASLSGSAAVAVIVGLDRASAVP